MQKTRSNTYTKKSRSDTTLRILVVNCQSIKNKKQEQENLVETSKPDIMIGTESWLSNDIQSTEIFPSGFTPYRKHRKTDSHGGVFILVSDKYLKLQVKGAPDLYIGSFYKPPKITDDEYLMHLEKNIQRI